MTPPLCIILNFSHKMLIFVVTSMEDCEFSLLQKPQGQGQKQLNYMSKLLSITQHLALDPLGPRHQWAAGVRAALFVTLVEAAQGSKIAVSD